MPKPKSKPKPDDAAPFTPGTTPVALPEGAVWGDRECDIRVMTSFNSWVASTSRRYGVMPAEVIAKVRDVIGRAP